MYTFPQAGRGAHDTREAGVLAVCAGQAQVPLPAWALWPERKHSQDPVQCDHSLHGTAAAATAAAVKFTALGSITKPCPTSAPTAPITRRHLSAGH